jgi:arginase
MRLVPVLFPCDLGRTDRGRYVPSGERGAPDVLLDLLEDEGVRLARPEIVAVEYPEAPDDENAPLKNDALLARAATSLAEVVAKINASGDFPLILGGDQTTLLGHVLGHAVRHPEGIGLAVLSDAYLDLSTPAPPVYDDAAKLRTDAKVTRDGNGARMVVAGALRMIGPEHALGSAMAKSSVRAKQTSIAGVRAPDHAQLKQNERAAGIEVWRMERVELEGEAAYRSMLSRHLSQGPIVLSIDASGLDPHLMTAVRDPQSDGLDWSFLKRSLEQCVRHVDRLLGLDIAHVDPSKDDAHQSATSRFAETLAPFLQRLAR